MYFSDQYIPLQDNILWHFEIMTKLMSNLYCINFTNCPTSFSYTFRLLTLIIFTCFSGNLFLLQTQFFWSTSDVYLVNIWHDAFYLILPISLNKNQNSNACLYLLMKSYTTEKSNTNMHQEEMTSSFTNFKEMVTLLSAHKNLLHYASFFFFLFKWWHLQNPCIVSFFQCGFHLLN